MEKKEDLMNLLENRIYPISLNPDSMKVLGLTR